MRKTFFVLPLLLIAAHIMAQEKDLKHTFERAKQEVVTLSYKATLLTKKFNSDKFTTKRFEVFAKRNGGRNAYNFDWEIVEKFDDGEQRFIFLGNAFFYVNDYAKIIGYERNISRLEAGEYFEAMRDLVLIDELLFDVDSLYNPDDISMDQSADLYTISIRFNMDMPGSATKKIFLNPKTFFPDSVICTIENSEVKLTQIIKTIICDLETNIHFPDSVLNPQHFLNQGYSVKMRGPAEDEEDEGDSVHFSDEQLRRLLDAELIDANDQPVQLQEMEADMILLDFWYASCAPCLKGLPRLDELQKKYRGHGLMVIGINCFDFEDRRYLTSSLQKNGFDIRLLYGKKTLLSELGLDAFPTYILLDRNKKLILFSVGGTDEVGHFVIDKMK